MLLEYLLKDLSKDHEYFNISPIKNSKNKLTKEILETFK